MNNQSHSQTAPACPPTTQLQPSGRLAHVIITAEPPSDAFSHETVHLWAAWREWSSKGREAPDRTWTGPTSSETRWMKLQTHSTITELLTHSQLQPLFHHLTWNSHYSHYACTIWT